MKTYTCDNNECKRRWEQYNLKFYEITFKKLPNDIVLQFDLCEDCYNKFRRKNKGYWL